MRRFVLVLAASALLAGCATPAYVRPASPAPPAWPTGAAYPPAVAGPAGLPWRDLIADEKLRAVIARMLADNRDLRASVANAAAARALYHVQRAAQFPALTANASGARDHTDAAGDADNFSASIGFSSFEIDLFGRAHDETKAQFEAYLSTESGARAARLSLVAETATAYARFAADRELLALARETQASAARTVRLTQARHDSGLAGALDLEDATTILAQAQSDVAAMTTQAAQDRNALELLVGAPVEDSLLPSSLAAVDAGVHSAPAGLSSAILLQRPDVLEAEHALKSANYDVGAARAAFFPSISLTSALGLASQALSDLAHGNFWSAQAGAVAPLIGGGHGANLSYAKAKYRAAVAQYEKAVQSAFRDVADALARRGTIDDQRAAQARLSAAAERSATLADDRYRAGLSGFLDVLTAQRTMYASRQSAIAATLADIDSRIALYAALGADASLE
jgi:multidrug efflux system outer membrane protein